MGIEIGIPVTRNTVDVAQALEVFPGEVQPLLSDWAVEGHLFYDGQNRVPSIRVLQPPADSSDRIERLLAEMTRSRNSVSLRSVRMGKAAIVGMGIWPTI